MEDRYRRRIVDDQLDELASSLPAVALEGPKAVGKTWTALQRAKTVHRLDDGRQLELVAADRDRLMTGEPPILVDEWQRYPASWNLVRRAGNGGELGNDRDATSAGSATKPSKTTTAPYRDVLEDMFVLDELPAWLPRPNHLGELAHAPKHHLADPALAAVLVGASRDSLLSGVDQKAIIPREGTFLGALFESFATLSVRVYAQGADAGVGHLRIHRGEHKVDLIVERADGRVVAIEVKLSETVDERHVEHLHWSSARLGDDLLDGIVVTTGAHAYRRSDGIAVVPLSLLGPRGNELTTLASECNNLGSRTPWCAFGGRARLPSHRYVGLSMLESYSELAPRPGCHTARCSRNCPTGSWESPERALRWRRQAANWRNLDVFSGFARARHEGTPKGGGSTSGGR